MSNLETLYAQLPPAQQQAVRDFAAFLFEKYKKERCESLVQNLGFANMTDFLQKQMLDVETPIEKIVETIRTYLMNEINYWQNIIQHFETKYAHDLTYLRQHFHELTQFDELEKEADEVEWETAFCFIAAHQKTLELL